MKLLKSESEFYKYLLFMRTSPILKMGCLLSDNDMTVITAIVTLSITSLVGYLLCRLKILTNELSRVREILKVSEVEALRADKKRAEEANRAKSLFLATMSHELRNPLNSIIGVADLIQHCHNKRDFDRYLQVIQTASKSLLELVNDVLDFSKIEADQIRLELQPTNLYELIEHLYNVSYPIAHNKNVELTYQFSNDVSTWVLSDSKRLKQAISNLLSNAVKYTEHGTIHISVTLDLSRQFEETQTDTQWIRFQISDTGIGIPEDLLPHIFDYYTRAPEVCSKRLEGWGLGLAISRRLATLMEGDIEVQSRVAEGSTFSFIAPFQTCPSQTQAEATTLCEKRFSGACLHPISSERKRILIVDDSDDNRLIIRRFLSEKQWEVHCATNGQEALNLVLKRPFDLILMDMQMPQMDGYEATRKIRELEQQNPQKSTPIVALTGNVATEDIARCLNAGCNGHIAKPVRQQQLLEIVHSHLI